jgi:hypothetical protein
VSQEPPGGDNALRDALKSAAIGAVDGLTARTTVKGGRITLAAWSIAEPVVEALMPLILADQERHESEAAEKALRDAAGVDAAAVMLKPDGSPWRTTTAVSWSWRNLLTARADAVRDAREVVSAPACLECALDAIDGVGGCPTHARDEPIGGFDGYGTDEELLRHRADMAEGVAELRAGGHHGTRSEAILARIDAAITARGLAIPHAVRDARVETP